MSKAHREREEGEGSGPFLAAHLPLRRFACAADEKQRTGGGVNLSAPRGRKEEEEKRKRGGPKPKPKPRTNGAALPTGRGR